MGSFHFLSFFNVYFHKMHMNFYNKKNIILIHQFSSQSVVWGDPSGGAILVKTIFHNSTKP